MSEILTARCSHVENGTVSSFSYPWQWNDGGRSSSRRPRQSNDCTVRALAIAAGVPYDSAYDLLKKLGRKSGVGFRLGDWLIDQSWATKLPFPAVKGQRRMNPDSFAQTFPGGVFICKTAKHVYCVLDGVVQDTVENDPMRCIYTAWKIDPIAAAKAIEQVAQAGK